MGLDIKLCCRIVIDDDLEVNRKESGAMILSGKIQVEIGIYGAEREAF